MQNKTKKFISALLIISIIIPIVLFFTPQKVNAFWGVTDVSNDPAVTTTTGATAAATTTSAGANIAGTGSTVTNTSLHLKDIAKAVYQETLKAIAKRLLQEMTKSTVNWINSGFHGSPLFLENPQSFFKDIVKSEIKDIVDTFGYDNIRFPFGKDFVLNTINSYKSTLANNASYTLSTVMNDKVQLYNYQNNFNVGGWNGFLINTQYPQNNYLGFQMLANEQLAGKVTSSPTANNAITKVKETLQQGQGFLSPQICDPAVNPNYNNGTNEFQKPSFKSKVDFKPPESDGTPEGEKAYEDYLLKYNENVGNEKTTWNEKNTCTKKDGTSGLINTTPGSVVSNQIMNAMVSPQKQGELSAAMGNSLSAIFDALLNHFLDKGLNSLASKANPPPPEDNWSYDGQTLGVAGESSSNWSTFPDEVISLNEFRKQISGKTIRTKPICLKKDGTASIETSSEDCSAAGKNWITEEIGKTNNGEFVPGDIANTETEKTLMEIMPQLISNTSTNNPGVIQLTQTLDKCLPGPDKGWEERLKEEETLVSKPFAGVASMGSEEKIRAANGALSELKFATTSFMDWITTKMISTLPSAIIYMDAVKGINDFPQQLKELTDAKRVKSQTLARLQSINKALESLSVTLKNKVPSLTQPEKNSSEEKNLIILRQQYNAIATSISSSISIEDTRSQFDTLNDKIKNLKELNERCVAERTVAGWSAIDTTGRGNSILSSTSGKSIMRKKNAEDVSNATKADDNPITTTGTEIEQFCQLPIISGYSHGDIIRIDSSNNGRPPNQQYTFRNLQDEKGSVDHDPTTGTEIFNFTDLPMLNAQYVYGDIDCTGLCSVIGLGHRDDNRISIRIDCNTVFKANTIDYTRAGDISL